MSSELEIEFKNIVTQSELDKIKSEFNIKDTNFKEQHNYYFDTGIFSLKEKGCALRIREKKNQFELTLKQPVIDGLLETTDLITNQDVSMMMHNGEIPEGEVKSMLHQLNIPVPDIIYFGMLTTKRAEVEYLDGLLVFDISSYLNKQDFEIEYEVKNRKIGEINFVALMNKLHIPIRKTENKIVRFYKEKSCLENRKE